MVLAPWGRASPRRSFEVTFGLCEDSRRGCCAFLLDFLVLIYAGRAFAGSISLVGFGIDSFIEVTSDEFLNRGHYMAARMWETGRIRSAGTTPSPSSRA
jgi:hypothetical protein